jgi:hypothetical protein
MNCYRRFYAYHDFFFSAILRYTLGQAKPALRALRTSGMGIFFRFFNKIFTKPLVLSEIPLGILYRRMSKSSLFLWFLTLSFGGQAVAQIPLYTALQAGFTDWSRPATPTERFLPFVPSVIADYYFMQGQPLNTETIMAMGAAVNTALQSRLLLLDSYQEKLYAGEDPVSEELEKDIRLGLRIFCGYNKKEAAQMPIQSLNIQSWYVFGTVQDSSLGIFATNKIVFVDQEFLKFWRNRDPLMYGFLIGYGLMHLQKQTFFKRQLGSITDSIIRTISLWYATGKIQNMVYGGAAYLGWTSLGDYPGDAQRNFFVSFLLTSARIGCTIFIQSILDGLLYQPISLKAKQRIYELTEQLEKDIIYDRLDKWLEIFQTKQNLHSQCFECCYKDRIEHIQKNITALFILPGQTIVRQWLLGRLYTSLMSMSEKIQETLPEEKHCKDQQAVQV